MVNTTIINRFWVKVKKGKPDDCWEWQAAKLPRGYGLFYPTSHKTMLAHRYVWLITYGTLPDDKMILHKCDNPSCVNPNHLFCGTQLDNMQDAANKKHYYPKRKIRANTRVELTIAKRNSAIRFLYTTGQYTMLELAQLVNISESSISLIVAKKR